MRVRISGYSDGIGTFDIPHSGKYAVANHVHNQCEPLKLVSCQPL